MENLLTIAFEAHNDQNNHHRRYQIVLGRDMLDDWTVGIHYGRCGQRSQEKRFASTRAEEMQALIRTRLRRRLTAPKRIGCAYRLSTFNIAPGFDQSTWLPGDVMAKFFNA